MLAPGFVPISQKTLVACLLELQLQWQLYNQWLEQNSPCLLHYFYTHFQRSNCSTSARPAAVAVPINSAVATSKLSPPHSENISKQIPITHLKQSEIETESLLVYSSSSRLVVIRFRRRFQSLNCELLNFKFNWSVSAPESFGWLVSGSSEEQSC